MDSGIGPLKVLLYKYLFFLKKIIKTIINYF